jgi:6-pyruvoyl-tetrahydropterin synthase
MLPVRTELCLKFEFCASHSLSVREVPHEHLWRVGVHLAGETRAGMILNLPDVRRAFEDVLAPLRNTFLNENTSGAGWKKACKNYTSLACHARADVRELSNAAMRLSKATQSPCLEVQTRL